MRDCRRLRPFEPQTRQTPQAERGDLLRRIPRLLVAERSRIVRGVPIGPSVPHFNSSSICVSVGGSCENPQITLPVLSIRK